MLRSDNRRTSVVTEAVSVGAVDGDGIHGQGLGSVN